MLLGSLLASACSSEEKSTLVRRVPFVGEDTKVETKTGVGWDSRLYTDLSVVDREHLVIPKSSFYIRTAYPDRLVPSTPWSIAISGLVAAPTTITVEGDLLPNARPMGTHVLECSGNHREGGFGLLSAASWSGVPLSELLSRFGALPSATRILISGFDEHSTPSVNNHSKPGASWIFSLDEIVRTKAFLATALDGQDLGLDHGQPVRLYVPNWYGCTCIKWVNEIQLLDDSAPATAHMIEFASRTHQNGEPALAKDFLPASMDHAAMPTRVEEWRAPNGAIELRALGILWGGDRPIDRLLFHANESAGVPVRLSPSESWTLWEHTWTPPGRGRYKLTMSIDDPAIRTRRLTTKYYEREIDV